ncbi:hypothetical protein I4U23_025211 [Adineta vaga]|nr:hypothetical protein I4U23_025211 [Adineta vaga]
MSAIFVSNKMSITMIQISFLLLAMLVTSSLAAPSTEELQEIYFETCEISCGVVSNSDEAYECRQKFCPTYVNYLVTGVTDPDVKPSLASSHPKEVGDFCATWLIHLIEQFGWNYRFRLNMKECTCAAGKDCLVK